MSNAVGRDALSPLPYPGVRRRLVAPLTYLGFRAANTTMAPWIHASDVVAHIAFGGAGLALAIGALLSRKGGRRHGGIGRLFIVCAGGVLATAVLAEALWPPKAWLYAATLSMAYQYVSSMRTLALRDRAPAGLDAIAALAALGAAVGLATWFAHLTPTRLGVPAAGWGALGWLVGVATYDLSRPLYPTFWRTQLRPLDHGLKMTGAAFAMGSAAAGNLLVAFQPWSQLAPAVLAPIVMIALTVAWVPRSP